MNRNSQQMMKNHAGIDTLTSFLWICFGITGGLGSVIQEDYLVSGIFFLVAVLYGYKLFKSRRKKFRDRNR